MSIINKGNEEEKEHFYFKNWQK